MSESASPTYIHGYLDEEQERLRNQALVIERPIYEFIDFSSVSHLLEIGSGVGAQTEILLRRFPHLQITGVEFEPKQIAKARENMDALGYGPDRVQFLQQDARQLRLHSQYDGAFLCWVLEHISNPLQVLISMKPFLRKGAMISITEVFNRTFYTYPYRAAVMYYWETYNKYQVELGGDPQVGARLGQMLKEAGYSQISLRSGGFHLDGGEPEEKRTVFEYWKNLMSSGAPLMVQDGKVAAREVKAMQAAMDELREMEDSVFYYRFIQATAFA